MNLYTDEELRSMTNKQFSEAMVSQIKFSVLTEVVEFCLDSNPPTISKVVDHFSKQRLEIMEAKGAGK